MDHQPDFWGHKERAEEARDALESPIYKMAMDALREAYRDELENAPSGSPEALFAHTKLKVLADVKGQLQHYINEQTFREARKA